MRGVPNRRFRTLALSLALLGGPYARTFAATVTVESLPDGSSKVVISGRLEAGDQARYARLISKERGVSSVHLNSIGGSVDEGYAFGREIENEGLTTVVERGARCESACFIIFIAGYRKIASSGARIGIHRASLNGADNEEGTNESLEMIHKLSNMDERTFSVVAYNLHKTAIGDMNYIPPWGLREMGVEVWP